MRNCDNQDLVREKLKDHGIAKGAEQCSLVWYAGWQSLQLRKACGVLQNIEQRQAQVIQEPVAEFVRLLIEVASGGVDFLFGFGEQA